MKNDNLHKPEVTLVEGDAIVVAVIFQTNLVAIVKEEVVDIGATMHICAKKDAFTFYTPVGDGEEHVFNLGDSRINIVLGNEKVLPKLTCSKILALNDVFLVPNIRENLI